MPARAATLAALALAAVSACSEDQPRPVAASPEANPRVAASTAAPTATATATLTPDEEARVYFEEIVRVAQEDTRGAFEDDDELLDAMLDRIAKRTSLSREQVEARLRDHDLKVRMERLLLEMPIPPSSKVINVPKEDFDRMFGGK